MNNRYAPHVCGFLVLVLVGAFFGRPLLSRHASAGCYAVKSATAEDIARGNQAVNPDAMELRVKIAASDWISRFPDPREAWCRSKQARNVRVKVGTVSELDRNVEHYLFARNYVFALDNYYLGWFAYYSLYFLVPFYSLTKIGDEGSVPTLSEVYSGIAGGRDGFYSN